MREKFQEEAFLAHTDQSASRLAKRLESLPHTRGSPGDRLAPAGSQLHTPLRSERVLARQRMSLSLELLEVSAEAMAELYHRRQLTLLRSEDRSAGTEMSLSLELLEVSAEATEELLKKL